MVVLGRAIATSCRRKWQPERLCKRYDVTSLIDRKFRCGPNNKADFVSASFDIQYLAFQWKCCTEAKLHCLSDSLPRYCHDNLDLRVSQRLWRDIDTESLQNSLAESRSLNPHLAQLAVSRKREEVLRFARIRTLCI